MKVKSYENQQNSVSEYTFKLLHAHDFFKFVFSL